MRVQHFKQFGLDFPYWYGVGQLQQESSCRESIVSFDGGVGVAQFMPKTVKFCEQYLGKLRVETFPDAIKAQAWYMKHLHDRSWLPGLWLTYQAYNGGYKSLEDEWVESGFSDDPEAMRKACKRRTIILKGGGRLNLCDVNYDYSRKVYCYGKRYSLGQDKLPFWGTDTYGGTCR